MGLRGKTNLAELRTDPSILTYI
jgi:long-subunit acyl-CoA synthetase (AMP-forming)